MRRRAGRAPGAALLVGIAHEPERREPLVALVMRRLDAADRLLPGCRRDRARRPRSCPRRAASAGRACAGLVVGAHHVVEDLLAVQRHHRLEAVAAPSCRWSCRWRSASRSRPAGASAAAPGDVLQPVAAIRRPAAAPRRYLPLWWKDSSLKHLSSSSSCSSNSSRLASVSSSGAPKLSTSRVW